MSEHKIIWKVSKYANAPEPCILVSETAKTVTVRSYWGHRDEWHEPNRHNRTSSYYTFFPTWDEALAHMRAVISDSIAGHEHYLRLKRNHLEKLETIKEPKITLPKD